MKGRRRGIITTRGALPPSFSVPLCWRLTLGVVVIGLMLWLFGVGSLRRVWANGGPHGDYTATTDKCAACHRTHTAGGPQLLATAPVHQLCLSCHGATATGANTNVEDGRFVSSRGGDGGTLTPNGAPLRAGGFVNYLGSGATSTHEYQGTSLQAWGGGNVRGTLGGPTILMTCTTCHDPHGSSNYRILRTTINGVAVTVSAVDENAKLYGYDADDDNGNGAFWPEDRDEVDFAQFRWPTDYSNVCGACHPPYHDTALDTTTTSHDVNIDASLYIDAGEVFPTYTDGNGVTVAVPLGNVDTANTGSTALLVCGACHLPHGTSAQMSGYAADPNLPTGGDSALLRWNNRGVCQACHRNDDGTFRGGD